MKIAVLMTCFNRREKTVSCLQALKEHLDDSELEYEVHLTDDGCTDGTTDAVLGIEPSATIYKGNNLFWAGGTRLAWEGAIRKGGYDAYLLLNDDTCLTENFVPDVKACLESSKGRAIIAGVVCNAKGERTYGGYRIVRRFPYRAVQMCPTGVPERISYSGANALLIPACVVEKVGVFPRIYVHGCADFDYCLRAIKHGFSVLMTPHYVGVCEKDHTALTRHEFAQKTRAERWRYTFSPKGLALKQWLYYQWSFFPWRVPFVFLKAMWRIVR